MSPLYTIHTTILLLSTEKEKLKYFSRLILKVSCLHNITYIGTTN